MSIFKIALRSIQQRGLGSLLTILSMALGVMLVVGVLTMHGVVSRSFKSNSNFPYDLIIGASGSSMQVTMNTVFYLSSPVENIPYEYYLACCDQPTREKEFKRSLSFESMRSRENARELASQLSHGTMPGMGLLSLAETAVRNSCEQIQMKQMGALEAGMAEYLVEMAIPVSLGDYLGNFRVVGTTPQFFEKMVLDIDTQEKMSFADGRPFVEFSEENGYFEAVLGSKVARVENIKVGDRINPIHGDPNAPGAHIHEQEFTVVGILAPTGTPHDRAAFVNMEGFFLMEDHAKPVDQQSMLAPSADWDDDEEEGNEDEEEDAESVDSPSSLTLEKPANPKPPSSLQKTALPIEQREVTAILIRSYIDESDDDGFSSIGGNYMMAGLVDEGYLESSLEWTNFRPTQAKIEAQAVSPVMQVTMLFDNIVSPIRWVLLALTVMICVVSGISILVGIYASMSQRSQEIAVMRALGANRSTVMLITLMESIVLALAGGGIGWVAGHTMNAFASPYVEDQTGVPLSFWDMAPGISIFPGSSLEWLQVSPELLLIPGLILLAIVVGVYPAISAYKTDVAESLSS